MTFTKCVDQPEVTAVAKLLAVTHVQFNVSGCWPNWKLSLDCPRQPHKAADLPDSQGDISTVPQTVAPQ